MRAGGVAVGFWLCGGLEVVMNGDSLRYCVQGERVRVCVLPNYGFTLTENVTSVGLFDCWDCMRLTLLRLMNEKK